MNCSVVRNAICIVGLSTSLSLMYGAELKGMIAIPEATYTFRNGDAKQTVHVTKFLIDKYEVTWGDFQRFMTATSYKTSAQQHNEATNFKEVNSKGPGFPVGFVSWDDANNFCRWKGKRLPTPQEWQLAALGTDGRLWPWGAWKRNAANIDTNSPAEGGHFPQDRSPYGVMDMGGNLLEWTTQGSMGGSYVTDWQNPTTLLTNLDDWVSNTGFRCACDAKR